MRHLLARAAAAQAHPGGRCTTIVKVPSWPSTAVIGTVSTFAVGDLANQTNHRLVHEVDQPFEHLGLAGEVTVQGRFAHADFGGQACGGDALGTGLLEHGHQGLQYLQPAFTGAWPFACRRRVLVALVL